jgi:Integrase core domain
MMSQTSKCELLAEMRPRYTLGNRNAKRRILDELVVITGYHRKYAIQLLNHPPKRRVRKRRAGRSQYTGPVRAALEKVWRTANCICGKRLVPVLAEFVEALEAHGELRLDTETRRLLLCISPATADRLLKRARQGLRPHGLGTTKPGSLLLQAIPIRTFAQWDDAQSGFMEVDLVAHCGTSTHGEYLNSLDMVDVKTRWVELAALINRSQATVTAAIRACQTRLPYRLLGLDSDNGSEFINNDLKRYCEQEGITFTRCRPYKKNDQAYVEQKNWTAVRQVVGYDRYEGPTACAALSALYVPLRLYFNFFQPVMALVEKQRNGAKVTKRYDRAKTPYQRVLDAPEVTDEAKQRLRQLYRTLNPAELLRQIQARQATLWKLAQPPADANMGAGVPSVTSGEPGFPAPFLLTHAAGADRNLNDVAHIQRRKVRSQHEATIPSG